MLGTGTVIVLIVVVVATWKKAATQKGPVWPSVVCLVAGAVCLSLGNVSAGGSDAVTEARYTHSRAFTTAAQAATMPASTTISVTSK